jgi:hypothetical protein
LEGDSEQLKLKAVLVCHKVRTGYRVWEGVTRHDRAIPQADLKAQVRKSNTDQWPLTSQTNSELVQSAVRITPYFLHWEKISAKGTNNTKSICRKKEQMR